MRVQLVGDQLSGSNPETSLSPGCRPSGGNFVPGPRRGALFCKVSHIQGLPNTWVSDVRVCKMALPVTLEVFMAKDIIRTQSAPSPPPAYSQAVRAAGLVFVSGTGPQDPASGKIVGDTIQEQTRQCLQNVSAILKAAGTSLERVVSATVILLEETDFAGMNEEWIKWFPSNPPARQGAKLPVRIPGMRVSIAAIAEA